MGVRQQYPPVCERPVRRKRLSKGLANGSLRFQVSRQYSGALSTSKNRVYSVFHCEVMQLLSTKGSDARGRLRRAEPTDAPALASCVEAAYHHYSPRIGQPPGPMRADYAEVIAHHQDWVAEAARQILGGLVLIPEEDVLLLDNIAVHPDYQGLGIGRALLERADAEALCQGYGALRLYTRDDDGKYCSVYAQWLGRNASRPPRWLCACFHA